jgi:pSer/pThr/pTyr-binding forkhead associated (FHA) protein
MTGQVVFLLRILMALSLYAFLGWAIWTLWRELKQQSRQSSMGLAPPILLQELSESETFQFTKPEIIIGRDPAHDISLNDKTVSTQHARLSYHHHQWWLEDLDSTNGTFLNEEPVSTPVVMASGDQVRCGQVVFTITIEETPKP